jgi:hypothetical protein
MFQTLMANEIIGKFQRTNSYIQLLHFLRQFAGGHLHAVEGEPFLA